MCTTIHNTTQHGSVNTVAIPQHGICIHVYRLMVVLNREHIQNFLLFVYIEVLMNFNAKSQVDQVQSIRQSIETNTYQWMESIHFFFVMP